MDNTNKKPQKRFVYADNAATTSVSGTVFDAMLPYLREMYGNPSGIYRLGREARRAVETAREQVAVALGASPRGIFFTSGGTESNNWAIKMTARSLAAKGKKHIITTAFEHHAVLNCVKNLEAEGFEATYLKVGDKGIVNPADVEKAIRPDTALVSVMYANNEIGTIQPVSEIGRICREREIIFHTDAVQAVGNVYIDVEKQNIDMLTLSGHKLHAPKGIGVLYVREGMALPPLFHGGAQEKAMRAGTENVAFIVGLGEAIKNAVNGIGERNAKVKILRDKLLDGIMLLPCVRLNGCMENRLAGNINVSIEGTEGEAVAIMLDLKGISVSSGSACATGMGPSHVVLALGTDERAANAALRITLNEENSIEDVDYILSTLTDVVDKLRKTSSLWTRLGGGDNPR